MRNNLRSPIFARACYPIATQPNSHSPRRRECPSPRRGRTGQTRCVLTSTASSDNLADRVAYILPKMPPNTSSELPAKPLRSLTEVYGQGRGRYVAARPRSVQHAD